MANPNLVNNVVVGYQLVLNITKNAGLGSRFKDLVDEIVSLQRSEKHDIEVRPLDYRQVATIDFVEDIFDVNNNVIGVSETISRAKMRLDNYYMIAYQRQFDEAAKVFEYRDKPGCQALEGSELVEESLGYPNELVGRTMGYKGLRTAVYNLRDGAEYRREFDAVCINEEWEFQPWMSEMIHDWKGLSGYALQYVDEDGTLIDPAKLPLAPTQRDWEYRLQFGMEIFRMPMYQNRAAAVCVRKLIQKKSKKKNQAAKGETSIKRKYKHRR